MKNESFLRFVGGKTWMLPHIAELAGGLDYRNYYEPFMGSATTFFGVIGREAEGHVCHLSDTNEELVNAFKQVQMHCDDVYEKLRQYKTDKESFYQVRDMEPEEAIERAARFIYINRAAYNGLWRTNKQGKCNASYGGTKKIVFDRERLVEASRKLQGARVECRDFADTLPMIGRKDLVFLDPPYAVQNEKETFVRYGAIPFSVFDQYRLRGYIDILMERGTYFIMTNIADERIASIFKGCGRMMALERNNLISPNVSMRGKTKDLLFTNIPAK